MQSPKLHISAVQIKTIYLRRIHEMLRKSFVILKHVLKNFSKQKVKLSKQ
jgi:hypothetical protein